MFRTVERLNHNNTEICFDDWIDINDQNVTSMHTSVGSSRHRPAWKIIARRLILQRDIYNATCQPVVNEKKYVKHKQQQVDANVFSALSEKTLPPLEKFKTMFHCRLLLGTEWMQIEPNRTKQFLFYFVWPRKNC